METRKLDVRRIQSRSEREIMDNNNKVRNNKISQKLVTGLLSSILVLATIPGSFIFPAYSDEDRQYTASGHPVGMIQDKIKAAGGGDGSVSVLADNMIVGNVFGIEATFSQAARIQAYNPITHLKVSEFSVPCTADFIDTFCNGRGLADDGTNFWYSILSGGGDAETLPIYSLFLGDGFIHKIGMTGGADILTIPDPYGSGGRGIGAIDIHPVTGNLWVSSYLPVNSAGMLDETCITDDTGCVIEIAELTTTGTVLNRCDIPFENGGTGGAGNESLVVEAGSGTFLTDGGEADNMFMDRYSLPITNIAGTPCSLVTSFSPPVGIGGIDFDLAGNLVVSSTFGAGISNINGSPFNSQVGSSIPTDADIEDITIKTGGCILRPPPDDPISMNTVRSNNIAKTIHVEKQVFDCVLEQGNIPVIVDVTIIAEIFEDMSTKSTIKKQAEVVTCTKLEENVQVIGCEVTYPSTDPVVVRNCSELSIGHPQEMNTVNKGNVVKTIEAQKEVFLCASKKLDVVLFTETWEDLGKLPNNPILKTTFESMRCVIEIATAEVESCQFKAFN